MEVVFSIIVVITILGIVIGISEYQERKEKKETKEKGLNDYGLNESSKKSYSNRGGYYSSEPPIEKKSKTQVEKTTLEQRIDRHVVGHDRVVNHVSGGGSCNGGADLLNEIILLDIIESENNGVSSCNGGASCS